MHLFIYLYKKLIAIGPGYDVKLICCCSPDYDVKLIWSQQGNDHYGIVVSAPAWDRTGCEFDS